MKVKVKVKSRTNDKDESKSRTRMDNEAFSIRDVDRGSRIPSHDSRRAIVLNIEDNLQLLRGFRTELRNGYETQEQYESASIVETRFKYIVKSILKITVIVKKVCTYLGQLSKNLTLE